MSKLVRFLLTKHASPGELRYPTYIGTMLVAWCVLGLAGAGFAATVASGVAAGTAAEYAVDAWWRRRKRRRDVANAYVPSPGGSSGEDPADDGAP